MSANDVGRAELREALEAFLKFMPKVLRSPWFVEGDPDEVNEGLAICAKAEAALAAPMRNCDIYETKQEAWLEWQAVCAELFPARGPSFPDWLFDKEKPTRRNEMKPAATTAASAASASPRLCVRQSGVSNDAAAEP